MSLTTGPTAAFVAVMFGVRPVKVATSSVKGTSVTPLGTNITGEGSWSSILLAAMHASLTPFQTWRTWLRGRQ